MSSILIIILEQFNIYRPWMTELTKEFEKNEYLPIYQYNIYSLQFGDEVRGGSISPRLPQTYPHASAVQWLTLTWDL